MGKASRVEGCGGAITYEGLRMIFFQIDIIGKKVQRNGKEDAYSMIFVNKVNYSHYHQRVFTHHDSFIHIHYRLYIKYHAGHLDEVAFDKREPVRLLLPRK